MLEARKENVVVVKVGTSTLTHGTGMLNIRKIRSLVRTISDLQNSGKRMILVSSGAISAGLAKIGYIKRPDKIEERQAAASVGQCELMSMYDDYFSDYGQVVSQMLLTKDNVDNPVMRANVENVFRVLLQRGCIPIINENDCISFQEIKFGGNDTLSAYVALLAKAELLINISDIDGLFDSDPRKNPNAKLIEKVTNIDDSIMQMAGGSGTERGTGGMLAKLEAAKIALSANIPMIIVNGSNPAVLYDIFEGKASGTLFDV